MRFALVGCGDIGGLRAEAVALADGTSLTTVCDSDARRADDFAARFGAAAARDWREAVGREDVDAVIVSTPPASHAEIAIGALAAGKHVLCEKPLARTPEECARMVEAARAGPAVLATGFNYRFYPSVVRAREILADGRIGDLSHVRGYAGYSATEHNQPWLRDAAVVGGGAMWDNGIHLIDLVDHFLGGVEATVGVGTSGVWGYGTEDNGFAIVRGPDGRTASLSASWTEWRGYRFGLDIYGARGCIRVRCFPMLTDVVWASETGGKTRRRVHLFPKVHFMEHLKKYQWVVTRSFVDEIEAFGRKIRGEPSLVGTAEDGLRAVQVAHAAVHGDGWVSTGESGAGGGS